MWFVLAALAAIAAAGNQHGSSPADRGPARAEGDASSTVTYWSHDRQSSFRFRFSQFGNQLRIHIIQFPNPHIGSCHVLHDQHGPYICWAGTIPTLSSARAVAAAWAEATLAYQRTGRIF